MRTTWENKLELGNDLIDTQHRMLVLLCRKLDLALKSQQSAETIQWVILELKKFTEFHFASEENLMRETGYPGLNDHAKIHTDLLMEFNTKMSGVRDHKDFPEDLLFFLNQWLLKHIMQDDLKIAAHNKHSEKPPIGKDLYKQFLFVPNRSGGR